MHASPPPTPMSRPRMLALQPRTPPVEASNADARVNNTTTPAAKAAAVKEKLMIPSGTILRVLLIDALSTDKNSAGDHFLASLAESIGVDGSTILPKGTKVRGRVIGVEDSGRVKGLASIRLVLTDIMQGNRTVAITTNTFAATADSSTTRDAELSQAAPEWEQSSAPLRAEEKEPASARSPVEGPEPVSSSRPRAKRSGTHPRRV
jgi:hypothetical protein